jgi:tetratricopeptide (TPR) repeat protein
MDPLTIELAKYKEEIYLVSSDVKSAYYERAITKIHELIVNHPNRAEAYYELGRMAYNLWRNDEAESNYIKALKANPDFFPTYTQYALILIKESRFDEAQAILERAKTIRNREDSDIYFYLGMLFQHKGDLESAIENYTHAIHYCINEAQIDLNLKFIRACKELRGWE